MCRSRSSWSGNDVGEAGVEAAHELHQEQSGGGEQVGEGLVRVGEDARVLGLEGVDHHLHDGLRREDQRRLLLRDVGEDVLGLRVVEVVGERLLLVQELLDGLVEDGLVEQARDLRDGAVLLGDLLAVAQEAELVLR